MTQTSGQNHQLGCYIHNSPGNNISMMATEALGYGCIFIDYLAVLMDKEGYFFISACSTLVFFNNFRFGSCCVCLLVLLLSSSLPSFLDPEVLTFYGLCLWHKAWLSVGLMAGVEVDEKFQNKGGILTN